MSKFSLSVYLNAYSDAFPSNNPGMNNFKWNRDLNSIFVNNPTNLAAQVVPGKTLSLFSGMRTLLQDTTTQYSIGLAPLQTSIYALTWVGGTAPNFRTPRVTGADATTQVNVAVNGPIVTFTSSPGTKASFTGLIPGMILSVTLTANNVGSAGNSIVLAGDGTSSINTLISNWNTANPSNQVTLTSGNGTQVPDAGTYASYTGTPLGASTPVVITANVLGTNGNTVLLTGNGTSTISALISAWNTANMSNQVTLTSGDGTQIPAGGIAASYTGEPTGLTSPITLTAMNTGTVGNSAALIGDGTSSIDTLIANFNINNPSNMISLTAGLGGQIPVFGQVMNLIGGVNPAVITLSGAFDADIVLTGGSTATPFNLISGGVVVGDNVIIGSNFNPLNQGTFQVIAVTSTSFTVENLTGVNEGPIVLGSGFASQISIFGSAGVQVGDTLVISGGFSAAIQGSYEITAVSAESVQFSSTSLLPSQGPVTTEAITIYSNAKTLVYIESDSILDVILNGVDIGQIEPFMISNAALPSLPQQAVPGIFMLKSTVWSLSVTNNGLNTANIYFAAVE